MPPYLQSIDYSVVNIRTSSVLRTLPSQSSDTKLAALEVRSLAGPSLSNQRPLSNHRPL